MELWQNIVDLIIPSNKQNHNMTSYSPPVHPLWNLSSGIAPHGRKLHVQVEVVGEIITNNEQNRANPHHKFNLKQLFTTEIPDEWGDSYMVTLFYDEKCTSPLSARGWLDQRGEDCGLLSRISSPCCRFGGGRLVVVLNYRWDRDSTRLLCDICCGMPIVWCGGALSLQYSLYFQDNSFLLHIFYFSG